MEIREGVHQGKKKKKKTRDSRGSRCDLVAARDPARPGARPSSRRDPVRCAANPGRASGFFFFFLSFFEHLLPWVFFFFFSFFSDENVGAALVVFFVFFLNVNRVLETRFPCGRHLEKVPRKRQTTHENRALKTRFRSPKSSL